MKKLTWIILMAISVLVLVSPNVNAEFVRDQKETLRGIKSISVSIEDLAPEAKEAGLSTDQIRTDVELKLRMAGIKVITPKEASLSPYLYININIRKTTSGDFIVGMDISLYQIVFLGMKPNISCFAATWSSGEVGKGGETNVMNGVRESVKDMIDTFINDYLAVNPIQQPTTPQGKN